MTFRIGDEWHLQRGDVVYISYPWHVPEYNTPQKLQATLLFFYSRGVVPVVSANYLAPHPIEIVRRRIIKRTIEKCDALIICYEEKMTYSQLLECLYAREMDIPIFRVYHGP